MNNAAALLIAAAGATFLGMRLNAAATFGVIVTAPLFFRVSTDGLALGTTVFAPQSGVTLPLSVLVAPIVFAQVLTRPLPARRSGRLRSDLWVGAFTVWAITALVLGAFLRHAPAPLVFVQALAPIAFYVLGRFYATRLTMTQFLTGMVVGGVVTCAWLGVSATTRQADSIHGGRVSDELIGGLTIYQAYDYFPLLLVVSLCGAMALLVQTRQLRYASAAAVLGGAIVALYSRGALLGLGGAIFVLLILWRRRLPRRAIVAVAVCIPLLFVGSVLAGVTATTRLVEGSSSGEPADESNQVRTASMRAAANVVLHGPLIGRGFAATERDPGTGVEKTLNTHNQYLDYAVRAGLPLGALLLIALGATLAGSWTRAREPLESPVLAGVIAALSAALISGLFQSPFVQPLTAVPLWFLLGQLATVTARPHPAG